QDYLEIESSIKNATIILYDVLGKHITLPIDSLNRINTSSLISGIYLLKIATQNKSITFKIIKE
ncbi:MAG: hypothetical protein ACI849_000352, partial [Patiriisocius sp.]